MNSSDIVKKHFTKTFRGYDVQEVDVFLDAIIKDYEDFEKQENLMILRINALLDEIERLEARTKNQDS